MKGDFNLEAAYALALTCVVVISVLIVTMALSATCGLVGERAPSPSPVVTVTARADSEAAPARSLADGNGEDGLGGGVSPISPAPESASTVTQSALTGKGGTPMVSPPPPRWIPPPNVPTRPTVTVSPTDGGALTPSASYTVIDSAPAIPPAQRVPVGSYEPWPAYLWPVVECLIQRESGGLEWKVSPGGDVGLMQIGPANFAFLAERGITRAMLFDGPTNIRAGWLLYVWWEGVNGDGLTPWKSTRGGCA